MLVESSWDETYGYIADKLNTIRDEQGPDAIAGISSARCTNEENYLMQKFIRAVIGTNNIDCCARVCHSPTAWGMQKSFGTGAATNSVADIQHTECMMVIGANPTSAHPVTGAKIKQRAMKGIPLIVIDPVKTPLAELADYHLQLRPGTNVAMLNMMLYFIVQEGLVDKEFIQHRCEDYESFEKSIFEVRYCRNGSNYRCSYRLGKNKQPSLMHPPIRQCRSMVWELQSIAKVLKPSC